MTSTDGVAFATQAISSTGLITGTSSPEDFIKKNMEALDAQIRAKTGQPAAPEPVMLPTPQEISNKVAEEQRPKLDLFQEEPTSQPQETKPAEPAPQPEEPQVDQEVDLLGDQDIPQVQAEHFKKMRATARQLKKEKTELEAQHLALQERLNQYESAELTPQAIEERDRRIAELEPYEKIVNVKRSPGYQLRVTQPLTRCHARLEAIANDYRIPKEVIQRAAQETNEAQLNGFLSEHFDAIGGLEVKQLIGEIKGIHADAAALEQEPEHALQELNATYEQYEQQQHAQRMEVFTSVANSAFDKALSRAKEEGVAHELIFHPTDEQHNQKIVQPVVDECGRQYGRLIKGLVANGLKSLPDEFAYSLARMVQGAVVTALAVETRNAAEQSRSQLRQNVTRHSGYVRPSIGGHAPSPGPAPQAPQQNQGLSVSDAAKLSLQAGLTRGR